VVSAPAILALRILLFGIGALLLWFGISVYEDEDRRVQNKIEEWWISLDDRRSGALSLEEDLTAKSTLALSAAFDTYFGSTILSLRAVGTSIALSLVSDDCLHVFEHSGPLTVKALRLLLDFILAASLPMVYRRSSVGKAILNVLGLLMLLHTAWLGSSNDHHFSPWDGLALGAKRLVGLVATVLTDFGVIALTRHQLQRLVKGRSAFNAILSVAVMAVIAILVSYVPWEFRWHSIVLYSIAYMNSADGLFLSATIIGIFLIIVNHCFGQSSCVLYTPYSVLDC